MSRKEWTRRFLLFLLSLFFTAMGVALTKHGSLGVSPISSVGNVMSCRFPALSLGNWLILWNCLLILGQMLLLGRRFRLFQLLQLPLSFLFGWFTDFGLWCVAALPAERYVLRLLWVFCGIAVLAFGVSLAVIADVIMNSGEAFVKALGTGFRGVGFQDISVLRDRRGKPVLSLSPRAQALAGGGAIDVSISHDRTQAVAFVVML